MSEQRHTSGGTRHEASLGRDASATERDHAALSQADAGRSEGERVIIEAPDAVDSA